MSSLLFKKLRDTALLPTRASAHAAGYDLAHAGEFAIIDPGSRRQALTGLAVAISEGFYGRIAPRSGLALRHGIDVLGGVIDSDYRGEIVIVLVNHGHEPFRLSPGERVAQLIIERIATPTPQWADVLPETVRASSGFGSTGT